MRKVLTIASVSQATISRPPRDFSRRCAPISAPRLEESMNVVSVRSTTTRSTPARDRRHHALLELGRGEQVDLAGDGDHVGLAAVDAAVLDRELDRHRLSGVPVVRQPHVEELVTVLGLDVEPVRELLDHVPDARHGGVDHERPAAAGAQRPDPSSSERVLELSSTSTVDVGRRARARGRRRGRRRAPRRRAGRAAGRRGRRTSRRRGAAPARRAGRRRSRRASGARSRHAHAGRCGARKPITRRLPACAACARPRRSP